jgi:AAA family ATP:ADP antiporter
MSERPAASHEFRPWRRYLWPVHTYELKKLIPMLIIFFLISFDYNILRTLKDSLLITAKGSGAEVIPFVKVWGVFPGAVLMTLWFTWLSNRLSSEKVFYFVIGLFLSYFFVFTFLLYPLRDMIHPHESADQLQLLLPAGFKGLVAMYRYWSFTIFYVMSELWSSTVLSVLFWGFANQVTKLGEAKRFYGLFGVGANFSGIIAGQVSVFCCYYTRRGGSFPIGEDAWHQSLVMMVSLVIVAGLLALGMFRWMNKNILTDRRFYDLVSVKTEGEVTGKLSLRQSFAYLFKSNYLLCIAVVVIGYNLVINLTEVMWKHQVKELYPDPNDYTLYMNNIVSIIGLVATLSSLFVASNAIRKFGWTFTAMLTPIVLLVTSVGFFIFFFLRQSSPEATFSFLSMSLSPLALVVFFGTAQNILSRGAKYSVFDATKEMSFVPLSPESKLVGKAVIDGVCSRFGKSGGSIVLQTLFLFFSSLSASSPYIAVAMLIVLGIWILTLRVLGQKFNALTKESKEVLVNVEENEADIAPIAALPAALLKEQQAV